jgi:hypothetical protein
MVRDAALRAAPHHEGERVATNTIDVNARLIWGRHKLHRMRLYIAVAGCIAGCVIVLLADSTREYWLAWIWTVFTILWIGYELYWLMRPASALVELLPQGIIFRRGGGLDDFIIPWTEVRGIDTIDIDSSFRGRPVTFEKVTVLLVSMHFYERVIHVDNFIMRGPGWDANYVPKGDRMQVALHHEIIDATSEEVRRQVEARWKAFGRKPPSNVSSRP